MIKKIKKHLQCLLLCLYDESDQYFFNACDTHFKLFECYHFVKLVCMFLTSYILVLQINLLNINNGFYINNINEYYDHPMDFDQQ